MPTICLIIPCYNEANRLKVSEFELFLQNNPEFDLLFVNDGSTDKTNDLIQHLCTHNVNARNLLLKVNSGKAEAIRQGFLHAIRMKKYKLIGFLDADLATPFSEIVRMHGMMLQEPKVKILLGSRWKRLGSRIERNWMRHYMGRIFATTVSLLFGMEVYDTQCGAKILLNQDLNEIFEKPFVSRWFFDIEILLRFRIQDPAGFIDDWAMEIPLDRWKEIGHSRIRITDFLSVPWQLWKIRRHYRIY